MAFINREKTRIHVATRAIDDLQKFTARIDTEETADVNVCIRPLRELSDLEREHYKSYGYGSDARREHPIRTSVTFARSAGLIALYYGSAHFLEHRSHRFIFDGNDATYHREPFNVDGHSIGSRPINLGSVEEIAIHDQAHGELMWLKSAIEGSRHTEWVQSRFGYVPC